MSPSLFAEDFFYVGGNGLSLHDDIKLCVMKKIFTLVVFLFSLCADAQITFQRWYDNLGTDKGAAIFQTFDNGYAMFCQETLASLVRMFCFRRNQAF